MKSNLANNATFPWIWEHTTPVANTGCSGCPVATAASHRSCVAFHFGKTGPSEDQRLDLEEMRKMQFDVQRKDRDATGFYGSQPGFLYNARDSYNYSDAVYATVVSASGYELTVEFASDPRAVTLFQARKRNTDEFFAGMFWVPGYGGFGVAQPGDIIEYSGNSILANKSRPTIKGVVSRSGNQVTYRIDQDCSNALTAVDPDDESPVVTVAIWNQAGNPEDWLHVQHPSYLKAALKRKLVSSAALGETKIVELSSKAVAHPTGFTNNLFVIEAREHAGQPWIPVGDGSRLFIRSHSDGTYDCAVALGSQKPAYAVNPEAELTDLTLSYPVFRISYWEESDTGCTAQCYKRCKHARPDYTRSIANYGAPNGIGVDENGLHWYCEMRKYPVFVESDEYDRLTHYPDIVPGQDGIMDTVTIEWHTPTGIANFPASGPNAGLCLGHNTCDMFQPAENAQDNNAPFRYEFHAGRFFRDLWGACNTRLRQLIPGYSQSWNFIVERIKHAGLQWLAGMDLMSPIGMHPRIQFIGVGTWGTDVDERSVTVGDVTSTYIRDKWAHNYDAIFNFDPDTHLLVSIDNPDGHFPADVPGFKTARDPINAAGTVSLNEIERLGIRNLRDDGAIVARGIHAWSKVLPDGQFIVPNCDTGLVDIVQDKQTSTFTRFENPYDVFGDGSFMAGALITIDPLRQGAKASEGAGSRTIYSATVEGNIITLELNNEVHSWSYLLVVGMGNSYDKIISWNAGGSYPIYPKDPQLINSFYEVDKTMGSPYGGVQRGDSATISISGFESWPFTLTDAQPFSGSEAPTFGALNISANTFEIGGYFRPSSSNTRLPGEDILPDGTVVEKHGNMTHPATGNLVTAGATVYTGVPGDTRPPTLAANTYWFDEENNRIYFSPSNDGTTVTVRYGVTGKVDTYEESYFIDTDPVTSTGIPYTDWTSADETFVKYVVGGADVTGYTASDVSGVLNLQFGGNDAGKQINVRTQRTSAADTPGDGYTLASTGYTSYAKKRDVVKLIDESGLLASRVTELPGKTINFQYVNSVYFPDGLVVQAGTYSVDAWTNLTAGTDYVSAHGLGRIYLSESWVAAQPEKICFRL